MPRYDPSIVYGLNEANAQTLTLFSSVAEGVPKDKFPELSSRYDEASRAGESHPRALPEPYVSLSTHTAPSVRPWPCKSGQWANRPGDDRITRASQFRAPRGRCRRRLNLRRTHLTIKASIRRKVGYSADL